MDDSGLSDLFFWVGTLASCALLAYGAWLCAADVPIRRADTEPDARPVDRGTQEGATEAAQRPLSGEI